MGKGLSKRVVAALLALGLSTAMSGESRAGNRIEGYVTYSYGFEYGTAVGATVTVVNSTAGKTFCTAKTGVQGQYTAAVGVGRYHVNAMFPYKRKALRGSTCCVDFRSDGQTARGVNVWVR